MANMFVTPQHSPLLSMPVLFFFGLWVGDGMLHLVTMASNALTICYCIDVEMVGGTETDALYAPQGLKCLSRRRKSLGVCLTAFASFTMGVGGRWFFFNSYFGCKH